MAKAAVVQKSRKKAGTKGLKILLGILIAALVVLLAAIYIRFMMRYENHFFEGTTINNINAAGKTPQEIESIFSDQMKDYSITLSFRGDQSETITADQIDYRYVPDNTLTELLRSQNAILWPKGFFTKSTYNVDAGSTFDEQKLTDVVLSLPQLQDANMTAPTKSHISYDNGSFSVADANQGTTLNKETVISAVKEAVSKSQTSLSINDITNAYASITDDTDKNALQTQADLLNHYAAASITYTLPSGETQVLDGNTLIQWLDRNENGDYVMNEDNWNAHIKQYVSDLAAK